MNTTMTVMTEAVYELEEYRKLKETNYSNFLGKLREQLDPLLYISSRLKIHFIAFFLILTISTFLFHGIEHWSYMEALYFTVVTLFTVGYGDMVPSTQLGRIVVIGLILGGITTFTLILETLISQIIILRDDPELQYIWKARKYKDHIIIVGFGNVGEELYSILTSLKIRNIVILDNDKERVLQARALGATVLLGDALNPIYLVRVGVLKANTVFLTLNNDQTTLFSLLTLRALNDSLNLFVHIKEEQTLEICDALGLTHVVWERFATTQSLYETIFHIQRGSIQLLSIDDEDRYGLTIVHSPIENPLFMENYEQGKYILIGMIRETGSFKPFKGTIQLKDTVNRDVLVVGSTNDLQLLSGASIEDEKLKTYQNVLILGLTEEIKYVLKNLIDNSHRVLVLEWEEERFKECKIDEYDVRFLHYTKVKELGEDYLKQVDLVLLDGMNDPDLLYFGIIFRQINKHAYMVAKISKKGNEELFYTAGYNRVLQPERASASELVKYFTQDIEKSLIYTNGVIRIERAKHDMTLKDVPADTTVLALVHEGNLYPRVSFLPKGSQILVFTRKKNVNSVKTK